ncbi:MAG TPA: helix-turn-helix domain-containing protein [Candidatus Competibacteraceae bacterium]|nr:helix-turn-helix domain-containing protein [Candidatus Competibacteraceae bacterium]
MSRAPQPAEAASFPRSPCPLASTLDLVGDKWTLLVVRDLCFGKRLFREFAESAEGIPSNILAERLKRLERAGLIEKRPYQTSPVRYEYRLTAKGRDLLPALRALAEWGNKHIPGTWPLPGVDGGRG